MKKITTSFLFALCIFVNGQANFSLSNNGLGLPQDNAILHKVNSPNAGISISYSDIQGTPYYGKGLSVATFSGTDETAPARYNAYKDEIEFIKDDKTFVLPKNDKLSVITFTTTKETLVYLNTSDDLSGYFFEVVDGKHSLYKKVKIKFIDAVIATNSYATDRPASFKSTAPIYYIRIDNSNFIKNPKNHKDILQAFPDKKENISAFLKENKIKVDKEEDLKKLVKFLNENS
ncbi:hypothetical protein [uncultured Chryseobacterium sp.]|jgi:hypothetical protein|uniref:hypothetical protein n=1 Tax=uncultured Chryseobacterium sp. TaxID=259322 RepID=UPI002639A6EF|nr:hypothetical protein [uncultured Chryseobacterium sp.]